jgi:hypothetical protein
MNSIVKESKLKWLFKTFFFPIVIWIYFDQVFRKRLITRENVYHEV